VTVYGVQGLRVRDGDVVGSNANDGACSATKLASWITYRKGIHTVFLVGFVDAVRAVSHLANIAQPEMRELCEEGTWMALYTTGIYEPWNKVGEEAYSGDCKSYSVVIDREHIARN